MLEDLRKKTRTSSLERSRADPEWVAKLASVTGEVASKYLSEAEEDSAFQSQLVNTLHAGGRTNYVQIAAPFELYALTRLLRPEHVVEVGVSAGVSSAYFLRALKRNRRGKLHSIDLPEHQIGPSFSPDKNSAWCLPKGMSTGWAVPSDLGKSWDLRLGRSGELLPDLIAEVETCDLFLYDVPYTRTSAMGDFQVVDKKLKSGSVVMADNCMAPLAWWARSHGEKIHQRRRTGLRGFRVRRPRVNVSTLSLTNGSHKL